MEVRHLTKVDFYKLGHGGLRAFAECMSSFAGIRSLTLRDKHRAILPEITERLTILTQLTELYLDPISRSYSLRLPTGIVDLHLGYTMSLVGASLNANEYLICLASLIQSHLLVDQEQRRAASFSSQLRDAFPVFQTTQWTEGSGDEECPRGRFVCRRSGRYDRTDKALPSQSSQCRGSLHRLPAAESSVKPGGAEDFVYREPFQQ